MKSSRVQTGESAVEAIQVRTFRHHATNIETAPVLGSAEMPADTQLRWYAVYTCSNHEKRVAEQLTARNVQHFLATYSSVRQWRDRRVKLELPLFPGYVFVRLALRNRLQALQVPGLVRLVGFNGMPTALPDDEIERLKKGLSLGVRVEPHPFLTIGRRVRIISGPFAGLEGIVKHKKKNLRVVISLEIIKRSVAVDVDAWDIVPCGI